MPNFEASEREIILRTSNDDDVWHVYVTQGAQGAGKILRNMTVIHKDENGTRGTLPKRAISIRGVVGGNVPKKRREMTDEQRRKISERFKNYHAAKRAGEASEVPQED